jgi:hypothetical protein
VGASPWRFKSSHPHCGPEQGFLEQAPAVRSTFSPRTSREAYAWGSRTTSDEQVEALATQVAAGITAGVVEILRQHEEAEDELKRVSVAWRWQNVHSVAVRDALAELIRAVDAERAA